MEKTSSWIQEELESCKKTSHIILWRYPLALSLKTGFGFQVVDAKAGSSVKATLKKIKKKLRPSQDKRVESELKRNSKQLIQITNNVWLTMCHHLHCLQIF